MIRNFCFLVLAVVPALTGCTGLKQFPDASKDYASALPELEKDYHTALEAIYNSDQTPEQQKRIRNKMIEQRMAVIDTHFRNFETALSSDNASIDFGVALVGVGVGAAGSLVAETTSQILSAVSGGLTGTQAAYNGAALYDKTLSALIAQMHASRKSIAVQIFEYWDLDIKQYPLWVARRDLDAYEFAGSLPGAILATSADAKVKEAQADKILLDKITPEALTDEAFSAREALMEQVGGLETKKVKNLVHVIGTKFPNIKPLIKSQYSDQVRANDSDGNKARMLLKRLVSLTGKTNADRDKWNAAIGQL